MITGAVMPNLEPMIQIMVLDVTGNITPVNLLIDTGFSGSMALPKSIIERLGLPLAGSDSVQFGDGRILSADLYEAEIEWDGVRRTIYVDCFGTDSLIGTELLRDYEAIIQFVNGGSLKLNKMVFTNSTM